MLLLFERPIDGLGFALDYERGLQVLGQSRNLQLRARAGLHVGEVLTWRNSDAAVRLGSKPLEVEGLAKPMAARLMSMARPGQILLSAVAEPLAHRAARELGERGQHLIWKPLGRWRFKGVPESQYIFEVGEPGIAPLRAPPNTPKAWRDTPLWRRPAALAAEVALLAAVGVGVWFVTRPQPAIAFNQRDWVVVADLRNLTGQSVLDDSLEQAFRISLEQSRYVNVLSDLKARDTLSRMKRSPETALDRAIASEIALRDGARAVILPTVSEVGGRVRVSAEVIDPHSQTTVYTETADGAGIESTLASIDEVTATLRGRLGEAVASIEKDSAPLPQVTTDNLDALRAYALAQKAYGNGKFSDALKFYSRATDLDPRFALAWLGQTRVQVSSMQSPRGVDPLRQAQKLRQRLPTREGLYLDAWVAEFDAPSAALDRWIELATLYPDFWPGNGNAAAGLNWQNRLQEALPFAIRNTSPRNDLAAVGFDVLGRVRLGLGQYEQAAGAFDQATSRGFRNSLRRRADVEAAQRRYANAGRLLATIPKSDVYAHLDRISLAIDQGRWPEAQRQASDALKLLNDQDGFDARSFLLPAAVADWLAGNRQAALSKASRAAQAALSALDTSTGGDSVGDAGLALSSAMFALRIGDRALSSTVIQLLSKHSQLMQHPTLSEQMAVLRAEELRLAGKPREALTILLPLITGHERYQTRVALMEAYVAAQDTRKALEQLTWLKQRRGLAYIEQGCGQCVQALNVADSNLAVLREAELLKAAGNAEGASQAAANFDRLWPVEVLNDYFKVRRSSLGLASN
ncbi:putative peptide modification system cyclase [Lysobacter niastensis]|uniref:Peptide modification system cyclase n=1 Tax=Lysobacter niastensis TaxID=380629 RepID=A0ABU1WD97_9GAMM|nr:putative peptide modification system cyclase [Lysobacter niastensis]